MGNLASAKAITFLDIETTHLDPRQSAILQISFTGKVVPKTLETCGKAMILVLSVTKSLIISGLKSEFGSTCAAFILTFFCSEIICHGTILA